MARKRSGIAWSVLFCLAFLLVFRGEAFGVENKRSTYALSHYIMAGIYESTQDYDRAVSEYKKALKADKQNPQIHLGLAFSYLKKSDIAGAIEELKLAAQLDPKTPQPHALLALLYSTQNQNELAQNEYETALRNASQLNPQDSEIYKNLGIFYLRQKRLKEAAQALHAALKYSPEDTEARFYLANVYDELQERDSAVSQLKEVLRLDPDSHEAMNYLGYIYAQEGRNLDQAQALITKALEFQPNNGAYLDSLGWVYFKQGKTKEALAQLKRADELLEDPVIKEHIEKVKEKLDAK